MACSAQREAVRRYERALQVLQQLPRTPETCAQAIDLHLALRLRGKDLCATTGLPSRMATIVLIVLSIAKGECRYD